MKTMEEVWKARRERVLGAMKAQGLEQMIVSDPKSVWYLTGVDVEPYERLFALYLRKEGSVLFLNRLFHVPNPPCEAVWMTDTDDGVGMIAARVDKTKPLGIDKEWPARFLLPLMAACPGMECRLASDCVDDARARKDETERELMRMNSRLNDEVMRRTAAFLKEGMTEKEGEAFVLAQYKELGCEDVSFAPIVSFGANAADPHHMPDETRLKAGDCIVIDIGGKKQRYCSDMTRTYFCKEADPKYAAIHDLVRRANEAAEALVKPGVKLSELDAAARDLIAAEGYGEYFTHRLGHFIGQTDHEQGDVSSTSKLVAEEGMIFSIEPGVYLPGEFGVRVEDLVLVTADGCEVLNQVDKHWSLIG
ncbi:M24 family metallopeptidase [Allofournierella sp.]|uniref:M24 family metallopeptidase n=1 Tax=Allofournierella sp. TaxID=1940256 RepID=UPI0039C63F14